MLCPLRVLQKFTKLVLNDRQASMIDVLLSWVSMFVENASMGFYEHVVMERVLTTFREELFPRSSFGLVPFHELEQAREPTAYIDLPDDLNESYCRIDKSSYNYPFLHELQSDVWFGSNSMLLLFRKYMQAKARHRSSPVMSFDLSGHGDPSGGDLYDSTYKECVVQLYSCPNETRIGYSQRYFQSLRTHFQSNMNRPVAVSFPVFYSTITEGMDSLTRRHVHDAAVVQRVGHVTAALILKDASETVSVILMDSNEYDENHRYLRGNTELYHFLVDKLRNELSSFCSIDEGRVEENVFMQDINVGTELDDFKIGGYCSAWASVMQDILFDNINVRREDLDRNLFLNMITNMYDYFSDFHSLQRLLFISNYALKVFHTVFHFNGKLTMGSQPNAVLLRHAVLNKEQFSDFEIERLMCWQNYIFFYVGLRDLLSISREEAEREAEHVIGEEAFDDNEVTFYNKRFILDRTHKFTSKTDCVFQTIIDGQFRILDTRQSSPLFLLLVMLYVPDDYDIDLIRPVESDTSFFNPL